MGLFRKKEEPSTKIGRVRKCPQCGASVPSSKVVCPECGWEFDDTRDQESAVARLSKELQKADGILAFKTKEQVISTFPIPKTKNDLLELTIFFQSRLQVGSMTEPALLKEYKIKYEECIMKAIQFYSDDKDFAELIAKYKKQKTQKKVTIAITIVVVVVLAVAYVLWKEYFI